VADAVQQVTAWPLTQRGEQVAGTRRLQVGPATTPAIRSLAAARANSSAVSAGSVTVCTTTVAVTPAALASGRKSASE